MFIAFATDPTTVSPAAHSSMPIIPLRHPVLPVPHLLAKAKPSEAEIQRGDENDRAHCNRRLWVSRLRGPHEPQEQVGSDDNRDSYGKEEEREIEHHVL